MSTAIISPLSMPGYSLGIDGASLGYSASLVVSTDTAARSQRFVLEKASDIITSSATYQNNGNYPHTVTDSRGNTTSYTYDTARGLQTGVTDALGNTTQYNYNSLNDRLESVTSGGSIVDYNYNSIGQLTGIDSPSGIVYSLTYDEFGNSKQVYMGPQVLVTNEYDTTRGLLTKSTYGNNHTIGFTNDAYDRVTAKSYNDIVKARFRYDKFGNLYETQDLFTNITYRYNYDLIGRIIGITGTNGTSLNYVYDDLNRVSKYVAKIGDNTNVTEYIYGDSAVTGQNNGIIYGVKQNDVQRISYAYDELSRLSTRTLNTTTPFVTQYGYHQGATAGSTTTLVKTVQNGNDVYEYAYDAVGNITQIKKNGTVYESYTYDSLGQLNTVTRGSDVYLYTYDNGGNILSEGVNGVDIKSYTYGDSEWRDLLTEFNGETITYDYIGNPLQYRDGFNFTWSNGRQLTGITKGTDTINYLYNADGLRASKTVNGTTTDYYWLEGVLLGQKTGNDYIIYLYDENGTAYGIICNNSYYYYVFNAQGDVVGIIDSSGNTVVEYDYSAWGEVLSITGTMAATLGQTNPIRYRGYYYDNETGFYYLQSRYYDPVTHRFINADGYVSTGQGILGNNMFAYCANNPVNYADPSGQCWEFLKGLFNKVKNVFIRVFAPKTASEQCLNFIAVYETFSPVPYDDGYGNLTIGYGHLIQPGETFTEITEQEGWEILVSDVNSKEKFVRNYMISQNVYWNQRQFDAMVSVAFNTKTSGFYNIADKIVAGWDAEEAFTWKYTWEKAKNGEDLGLWRRRMDEIDIFLYGTYEREYRTP